MLGLRPLGQLVISFALIFSVAITMTLAGSLITGDAGSIAINLAIVVLGITMLFLPLRDIHGKMADVKEKEELALGLRIKELITTVRENCKGISREEESIASKIEALLDLQRVQLLREEIREMSEWPFETRSVERLVAILIAIFSVLLTRLLQVA